jgi:hypothetical protein
MAADIGVIWVRGEQKYFCKWDWTAQISLIRLNKFAVARNSAGRMTASGAKRSFDETDKCQQPGSSPPAYTSFDQCRGKLGRQCAISTEWLREAADVVSDMPMDRIGTSWLI